MQTSERQKGVLNSIARQDQHRPRDRKPAIKQRLPNGTGGIEGFAIGYGLPALAVTASEKHAIGLNCRPVREPPGDAVRVRAKFRRALNAQRTVSSGFKLRILPKRNTLLPVTGVADGLCSGLTC